MIINIAQATINTFWDNNESSSQIPASDRKNNESLREYIGRLLNQKVDFIINEIDLVFKSGKVNGEYIFFTLPEMFWNPPWDSLKSKDELGLFVDYYMSAIYEKINLILDMYPRERYGNIVIVGGSVSLPVLCEEYNYYESLNYLIAASNFSSNVSMWPKRYNSAIDYGTSSGKKIINGQECFEFTLPYVGVINVLNKNTTIAEHNNSTGYGAVFDNNFIEDCQFSVNLCLDYENLSLEERGDELYKNEIKVDFLIACGMTLSAEKEYPFTTAYACRNDGFYNSIFGAPPMAECYPVTNGFITGDNIFSEMISNTFISSVEIK